MDLLFESWDALLVNTEFKNFKEHSVINLSTYVTCAYIRIAKNIDDISRKGKKVS